MKNIICIVSALLILGTYSPSFAYTMASEKKQEVKEVFLTTEDIKDAYKVIGIVSVRSGETNLDNINDKLKDQAKSAGADCVIGVNYLNYSGYIYAFGTAVKIKE